MNSKKIWPNTREKKKKKKLKRKRAFQLFQPNLNGLLLHQTVLI